MQDSQLEGSVAIESDCPWVCSLNEEECHNFWVFHVYGPMESVAAAVSHFINQIPAFKHKQLI